MVAIGEPGHVSHVGQDPGGAGGTYPVDVHQVRSAGQDRGLQLGLHDLEPGVVPVQAGQFPGSHPAAGLSGQVTGAHPGQQGLVLRGGSSSPAPRRAAFPGTGGASG